jgi:hypothetical protein
MLIKYRSGTYIRGGRIRKHLMLQFRIERGVVVYTGKRVPEDSVMCKRIRYLNL